MVSQSTAIQTVKHFADALRAEGIALKKVILFGSFARNTQHEYSDIDVALVADEFMGVGFVDIRKFLDVTIQPAFRFIEPHTFNTRDFEDGNPWIEEIRRTGLEIV